MANLTPGVLMKLLQSMNSDAKPFGEHRSAVLQVTGIIAAPPSAPSADDLWPSDGFYIQLSDSVHSTYVSLSDSDADHVVFNRPQLGQLVQVDRLFFDVPVPRASGLRPIPSSRPHPLLGSPEPLIAISSPSHVPGFVIQFASPSADAAAVKPRPVLAPKENFLPAASAPAASHSSFDSTSSVSKPKRRFSSPAAAKPRPASPVVSCRAGSRAPSPAISRRAGSRAPSPVPSKCEVPSLVAAKEENRGVVREPAIVVPSRYRQQSPVTRKAASPIGRKGSGSPAGRRLSSGMKFSPAVGDGGGKRKVGLVVAGISRVSDSLVASRRSARKSWEDYSSSPETSSAETKEKGAETKEKGGSSIKLHAQAPPKSQIATSCPTSDANRKKPHRKEESEDEKRRTNCNIDALLVENQNHMAPKFAVYDRKWTDGSIPLDNLSQNLLRLGKEAIERRNIASMVAAEAMEEALATESIIRTLSMFSDLCLTSKTGTPTWTINSFLSIYDDIEKRTSIAASLAASRNGNAPPVDALNISRAKSATLWVEAALMTDLEILNLIKTTSEGNSRLNGSEKVAHLSVDFPRSYISKRHSPGIHPKNQTKTQTNTSPINFWSRGQEVEQTFELAKALKCEMQKWFIKFVKEAIIVKKDVQEALTDTSRVAALLIHLKRVSNWLCVVKRNPEDEMLVEKIDRLQKSLCNFVTTHIGPSDHEALSLASLDSQLSG